MSGKHNIQIALLSSLLTLIFMMFGCRDSSHGFNRDSDLKRIADNLHISEKNIKSEWLMLDDYRNYYGVYFIATGVDEVHIKDTMEKMTDALRIKYKISIIDVTRKGLKKITWGPLGNFRDMNQYIGTWNGHYLVYIAFENGTVSGYFESEWNVEPGPGPFH